MSINEVQNITKEKQLEIYIKSLAAKPMSDSEINDVAEKLLNLYVGDYRHSYSQFFPIIIEIDKEFSTLEILSSNLEELMQFIENENKKENSKYSVIQKTLIKLKDHLSLEIARYQYYLKNEKRTDDLDASIKETTLSLNKAKRDLQEATKKIKAVQTELITVLSIFAAIVMAFSGSMNVLGGAFNSLGEVSILQSVFFLLLAGIILFNLIFALMYFVAKITDRNIYARCESYDCTCKDGKTPKCSGFIRIYKRLPYVFWFNAIMFVLLVIDIICMCCMGLF